MPGRSHGYCATMYQIKYRRGVSKSRTRVRQQCRKLRDIAVQQHSIDRVFHIYCTVVSAVSAESAGCTELYCVVLQLQDLVSEKNLQRGMHCTVFADSDPLQCNNVCVMLTRPGYGGAGHRQDTSSIVVVTTSTVSTVTAGRVAPHKVKYR